MYYYVIGSKFDPTNKENLQCIKVNYARIVNVSNSIIMANNSPSIKAGFDGHSSKIEIKLPVISFKDDNGYFIAHIPSLDLSGYGKTKEEALSSLDIVLVEYFDFAIKHNTLHKDLIAHGWKLNNIQNFDQPSLSDLLKNDPLKDIINNTPFTREDKSVQIPAYC